MYTHTYIWIHRRGCPEGSPRSLLPKIMRRCHSGPFCNTPFGLPRLLIRARATVS